MARQRKDKSGAEVTTAELDVKNAETAKAVLDQLANTTPSEVETKYVMGDLSAVIFTGDGEPQPSGLPQAVTDLIDTPMPIWVVMATIANGVVGYEWEESYEDKDGNTKTKTKTVEAISFEWQSESSTFLVYGFDGRTTLYIGTIFPDAAAMDAAQDEKVNELAAMEAELAARRAKLAKKK